ncbi:MAG: nicotinate-nucleotide adenylyltransferase [bacterium]|jgi:nicotinate-nucleotide adenylyltransferase
MTRKSDLRAAGRIGVFGGTFDPVHYGHLVCAEQLREAVGLDVVLFIPCNRQPHKPGYVPSDPAHRLAMLRAATRRYPAFKVSDMEIRRGGVSYTAHTIRGLRGTVGAGPEIWLMLGMDAFLEVHRWKDPEVILSECRFAVAARPGYSRGRYMARAVARSIRRKCRFVEITGLDISSTDIRKRVTRGKSIRFLVPRPVEAYVRREGLYS